MSVILDEEEEHQDLILVKGIKKKLRINDTITIGVLIPTLATRVYYFNPLLSYYPEIFKYGVIAVILLVFRRYFLTYKLNKAS